MPQEAVEDFCRLHGIERWRDYFSFFFLANAVDVPTNTGHKNAFYGVYTYLSLSNVLFLVILFVCVYCFYLVVFLAAELTAFFVDGCMFRIFGVTGILKVDLMIP